MGRLKPEKLYVRYAGDIENRGPESPRRYTLTHSDMTGELFLTIGADFDRRQISGPYTRLMRDEVLAEWLREFGRLQLHVYLHVSGGFVVGPASWRAAIFRRELPLALEALRHGDRDFFANHPVFDEAPVLAHFNARQERLRKVEAFGRLSDYRPTPWPA